MNSGGRVSIPDSVRKTIHNIKEITGNHSEDEIYAMLKECSMDPNETCQKLLSQDPFHEVRRKRDRKKEQNPSKESTEPRWKTPIRGNRVGRGNHPSRHSSHDAGSSRNSLSGKENEINQGADDGVMLPAPQDKKNKETSVAASSSSHSEVTAATTNSKLEGTSPQIPPEANKSLAAALSASDPILMPSNDSRLPVGTIKREVGSQRTVEQVKEIPSEIKTTSGLEVGNSMQGKMLQGEGNSTLLSESSQLATSTHVSSSIGRPPSNYNNSPQQAIGPAQKVGGPVKEWKPKPTNPIPAQGLGDEVPTILVEGQSSLKPTSSIPDLEDKKLEVASSHISDGRHVIIPNHLYVPEAEKLGFRFGSFDFNSITLSDKTPSLTEEITEHIEEQTTRNQDALVSGDDVDYPDRPSSSSNVPENLSPEGDFSSNVGPDHTESKQETSIPTPAHQYPVVHPSSNLSFGFIPPIIGSQMAPSESNESQARDASRVPSFVVQQPFDPAGYYPQFYRTGVDSDGRISPFHPPGVAAKYNGNVPVLSPQASQASQEAGNSSVLSGSNSGSTSLPTQAGGVMQSSIAVTQQPLPVFRQPPGLHLPHYPPNYIPYGPYFSPFYMPPPAIHQFLSNGAFPQQPQAGSMYPAPPVATSKYSLAQYNPGSNTANPGHIGVQGTYGPSPAVYNPNPAVVTAGNSISNEDLGGSQLKESNVYVTGQQSEGSGVWLAAPGREISGLQASSFYNLPQGGHVAYTPTQAAHGTFAGMYHPAQPVTTGPIHPLLQQPQTMAGSVDIVGPPSSVYQQPPPQPAQINWPNNY